MISDSNVAPVVQVELLKGRLAMHRADGSIVEAGSKTLNGHIPVGVVIGLLTTENQLPPSPQRLAHLCFESPLPHNWKPSLSQAIARLRSRFGLPIENGSWKLLLPAESVDLQEFAKLARRLPKLFDDGKHQAVVTDADAALALWEFPPSTGLGAFPLLDHAFDSYVALHKRTLTLKGRALMHLDRPIDAKDAVRLALETYPSYAPLMELESQLERRKPPFQDDEVPQTSTPETTVALPPPPYPRFVDRSGVMTKLTDALNDNLPVMLLTGLGGTGKTAAARFFTEQQRTTGQLRNIVWISDRTRPGTTTLETVLTHLSLALDAPALGRGELTARAQSANSLMAKMPTLLVIDNFETIDDEQLSEWIFETPAGSKVFLTSIWTPSPNVHQFTEVRIGEMTAGEAREFCDLHLARAGYPSHYLDDEQKNSLLETCWGNPRLIEWAVTQLKWQSLEDILKLIQGVDNVGDSPDVVIQDLLRQSWERISAEARRLLRAYAHFPYGARPGLVAELLGKRIDAVAPAIEELAGHCLLDWDPGAKAGEPSYLPEPLSRVRAFASAEGEEWDHYRDAWMRHHRGVAESVGFCPGDIGRLAVLDDMSTRRNLEFALQWALVHRASEDAVVTAKEVRYWYYCRGLWGLETSMNRTWYELACLSKLWSEAFDAAVYALNIAGKQGSDEAAEESELHLCQVAAMGFQPSDQQVVDLRHARALVLLSRGQFTTAAEIWAQNLQRDDLSDDSHDANLRWYVQCLHRAGIVPDSFDIDAVMSERIAFSSVRGYMRSELMLRLLAAERLIETDQTQALSELLKLQSAVDLCDDAMYRAQHQWLLALASPQSEASSMFRKVAALFEALGLRDRAEEARRRGGGEGAEGCGS